MRPLLLVLEDAHWSDPTTLELMDRIIDRVPRSPVLVVITYRPDFAAPWIGRPRVAQVTLNRFDRRLCALMCQTVAGAEMLPDGLVEGIVERTDGVPLFVEELTRVCPGIRLLDHVRPGHGAEDLSGAIDIPTTLKDSLEARLDRLGPAKEVAQTAAVIGREFEFGLLGAVVPAAVDLAGALDRLEKAELIFRRGTPPTATYTFKHALVQDTAYESLLRTRREAIHAAIADCLDRAAANGAGAAPELLAHHHTAARQFDPAARYWYEAGQAAFNRSAMKEALAHVNAGLNLVEQIEPQDGRAERESALQALLALVLKATAGIAHAETGKALARANALLQGRESSPHFFPVLFGLFHYQCWRGPMDAAHDAADRLLELARRAGEPDKLLAAETASGMAEFMAATCLRRSNISSGALRFTTLPSTPPSPSPICSNSVSTTASTQALHCSRGDIRIGPGRWSKAPSRWPASASLSTCRPRWHSAVKSPSGGATPKRRVPGPMIVSRCRMSTGSSNNAPSPRRVLAGRWPRRKLPRCTGLDRTRRRFFSIGRGPAFSLPGSSAFSRKSCSPPTKGPRRAMLPPKRWSYPGRPEKGVYAPSSQGSQAMRCSQPRPPTITRPRQATSRPSRSPVPNPPDPGSSAPPRASPALWQSQGQDRRGARSAGADPWLVHRGARHAGLGRRQGAAG